MKGIPWRFCAYWDEQPAARLGMSMLRLGICQPGDWTGSAVDFVQRGFERFCKQNGIDEARKVWDGDLLLDDQLFDLSYLERQQIDADASEPPQVLFLVVRFNNSTPVPLGPALFHLEQFHPALPAAFFALIRYSLQRWMPVYDHMWASGDAEKAIEFGDETELKDSVYPELGKAVPRCLRKRLGFTAAGAFRLLQDILPTLRGELARELVIRVLDLFKLSEGYKRPWPKRFFTQHPEYESAMADWEGPCPGCLLCWYEGDPISACFDEMASQSGQNGPLEPSHLLVLRVGRSCDSQVKSLFDYIGAMSRALACAAQLVEIIQDVNDEHISKHRQQSTVPVESGAAGVREK